MKAVAPVALLAAGALALAAWLLLPRVPSAAASAPPLRAVLVDVSASATRAADWLPWVRDELCREAASARAAGAELAVVCCAAGVASAFPPGPPADFLDRLAGRAGAPFDPRLGLDPGATRLADALLALEPLLADPRRQAAHLALLAPLTYTGASPAAVFARLGQAGVTFETRAPPPAAASDLGLVELLLAPRVELGAPLVARARCTLQRGSDALAGAEIELELDNQAGTVTLRRALTLPQEDGPFEVLLDCGPAGPGRSELRARCRLAAGLDRMPENDRGRATTRAAGARVVGVVSRAEERAAARAWLVPAADAGLASPALPGIQLVFLAPDELELELAGLDALVSFDVRPSELPESALSSFLRRGGGWLALSGWRFLGDWLPGEAQGELARLLPCEPGRGAPSPRHVVLLVDGSGSMAGAPFETVRAAALELVGAALPSDRVSLRFFTVRLEPEHLLKERSLEQRSASRSGDAEHLWAAARELLALRVPSGTTFLLRSLQELEPAPDAETLVLLLTDGRERDVLPDARARAQELGRELAARRVRLVVIAAGEADLALLSALAGGEEHVRRGESLEALSTLFARELFGGELAEGHIDLDFGSRAPGSLVAEVADPSAELPPLAPIERHLHGRLRPGAEALWQSAAGEPVLALARAGLGRTALFASQPAAGWAGAYGPRTGTGPAAEFEGLLRWLARGPERAPDLRARLAEGLLTVSGFEAEAPARVRARLVLRGAEEREEELELLPGGAPGDSVLHTRSARPTLDAALEEARLFVSVFASHEEAGAPWRAVPIERVLAQEFAHGEQAVPRAWLASQPRPAADGERRPPHPAGPWVLGLGLALLFSTALVARGSSRG